MSQPNRKPRWLVNLVLLLSCVLMLGSFWCLENPAALMKQLEGSMRIGSMHYNAWYTATYAAVLLSSVTVSARTCRKCGLGFAVCLFSLLVTCGQALFAYGCAMVRPRARALLCVSLRCASALTRMPLPSRPISGHGLISGCANVLAALAIPRPPLPRLTHVAAGSGGGEGRGRFALQRARPLRHRRRRRPRRAPAPVSRLLDLRARAVRVRLLVRVAYHGEPGAALRLVRGAPRPALP